MTNQKCARAVVQVSLENDYVGYVTVFLPMYVALLIPSAFAWYFAALAYQFYCWRVIGTSSPLPKLCAIVRLRCGACTVVTSRVLTVLWDVQDRSRRWSHRSTGSPPISAGSSWRAMPWPDCSPISSCSPSNPARTYSRGRSPPTPPLLFLLTSSWYPSGPHCHTTASLLTTRHAHTHDARCTDNSIPFVHGGAWLGLCPGNRPHAGHSCTVRATLPALFSRPNT